MGLVDLHLHLLPGIDDGARSLHDTLAMARVFHALGYTALAPSPHARGEYASVDRALCLARLDEVRAALAAEGQPLALHVNAENYFLEPTLFEALAAGTPRTLGGGRVLLVEAPYQGPVPMLGDMIFRMKLKGVTPLIAHPERCFEFEKKGRAAELVGQGALLQLDLGALLGRYGKTAEKLARRFLDEGLYAVAASDLHSPVGAEQWLSEALRALEKAVGARAFSSLVRERPTKLLAGQVD